MRSLRGLDVFEAMYYPPTGDPKPCTVSRATLAVDNDYGMKVIQSGARIGYLVSEIGDPPLGSRFEFDGTRYTIEDKESSQDSSWRFAHCTERKIDA